MSTCTAWPAIPDNVMCLQVWLPESPRWLLLAGRHEDAREALVWTRGKPAKEDEMALTEEFDDIKKSSAETMPHQGDHWILSYLPACAGWIGLHACFVMQWKA